MTNVGKKRKSTRVLEEATKRMRIDMHSTSRTSSYGVDEESSADEFERDDEEASDDGQVHNADTPLTPFSPVGKFPSELKTIRCTYEGCTKSFNRPARLAAHLRSHTNDRPFACSYSGCDKTYIEEKHLRQHIKGTHTHEKPYGCDWDGCNKSFLTATRLRRHHEAHEGRDRFRCTSYPPCNQTFRKHQTLQRHIRADHLRQAAFPCTYVNPETQKLCNMGFDTGGALRKHEDRIHGAFRFWCDECSMSETSHVQGVPRLLGFRTKTELAKHVRAEHSNCIFCDLKCGSQLELERHVEIQHSKNDVPQPGTKLSERKIIPCTIPGCAKTFTKKHNLDVHIRTAHNGLRFSCSTSFTSSTNFKSPEIALWAGTNACGRDFVSKATLEDHIRTQHLNLPSVVNANRPKRQGSKATVRSTQPEKNEEDSDVINLLTGIGYTQNPSRNIPCRIPGCQWLFMRQYDLIVHLQSAHDLPLSEIEAGPESNLSEIDAQDSGRQQDNLDATYDQEGLEWEMQYTAVTPVDGEDGNIPFWIGADDQDSTVEAVDTWSREEEEEMRRLCDQEQRWDGVLDPELTSM